MVRNGDLSNVEFRVFRCTQLTLSSCFASSTISDSGLQTGWLRDSGHVPVSQLCRSRFRYQRFFGYLMYSQLWKTQLSTHVFFWKTR